MIIDFKYRLLLVSTCTTVYCTTTVLTSLSCSRYKVRTNYIHYYSTETDSDDTENANQKNLPIINIEWHLVAASSNLSYYFVDNG